MFITLEGIEGSGKSTQAKMLQDYFHSKGIKCILTREPGGGNLSEKIRELILADQEIKDGMTEYLLFAAARRMHIIDTILPALQSGHTVICDRFFDSSLAYQGYAKKVNIDDMTQIYHTSTKDISITPDITLILDIAPKLAITRLANRSTNHYDQKHLLFHETVRDAFLSIAKNCIARYKVLNASLEADLVHKEILKELPKIKNHTTAP